MTPETKSAVDTVTAARKGTAPLEITDDRLAAPAVDFGAMVEEFAAAQNKAMAALYRGEKGKEHGPRS
jgi:hypothetical protein